MKSLFDIRIKDEHCLFAYLKESEITTTSGTYPPAYDQIQAASPKILSIYTYTAEISSLTLGASFVVRQYVPSMDVPVLLAKVSNSDDCITVIPDCGFNLNIPPLPSDAGIYRLIIIGKGRRYEPMIARGYDKLDTGDEYVVLLLKKKGEYFERMGLSTVPAGRPQGKEEQGEASQKPQDQKPLRKSGWSILSIMIPPSDDIHDSEEVMDPGPAWKLQWVSLA